MNEKPYLLIDFDGVIVDTKSITLKNLNLTCKKLGIKKQFNEEEFLCLSEGNFFNTFAKKGFDLKMLNEINRIWIELTARDLSNMKPVAGIKPLLNIIRESYDIYLVTSNFRRVIQSFIDNNSMNYFINILDADMEKSKTKKISYIVKKKRYADSPIIFVTDTKGDIIEGKKAGVICVGVTWGYHNKTKLAEAKPDYIFDIVGDLEHFLLNHINK